MKNFIYISFLVLAVFFSSCAREVERAAEFNDTIIKEHVLLTEKVGKLISSFQETETNEAEKLLDEAVNQVDTSLKKVEALSDFDNEKKFKQSAIEVFKTYQSVLGQEYKQLLEIYQLPTGDYTQAEKEKWQELSQKAYEQLNAVTQKFEEAQLAFAKKYKFELN